MDNLHYRLAGAQAAAKCLSCKHSSYEPRTHAVVLAFRPERIRCNEGVFGLDVAYHGPFWRSIQHLKHRCSKVRPLIEACGFWEQAR